MIIPNSPTFSVLPFHEAGPVRFAWLSFPEFSTEIIALREQVYVQEQGMTNLPLTTPKDEGGLHLGAFIEEELVSVISAYSYRAQAPYLQQIGLPSPFRSATQLSCRVTSHPWRGTQLALWMGCKIWLQAIDLWQPDYHFLVLKPQHFGLAAYYKSVGYRDYTSEENRRVLWIPRALMAETTAAIQHLLVSSEAKMKDRLSVGFTVNP
ncbi:MAG TPA: hypothetical protein DCE41_11715 [Cytophagales bacterium]|nr:hypothetical protein [Cytophagales bacterium]HAP61083.1 hypothetical protein [Cytophagales bacterium]